MAEQRRDPSSTTLFWLGFQGTLEITLSLPIIASLRNRFLSATWTVRSGTYAGRPVPSIQLDMTGTDPVPQTGATKNGMEAVTHPRHSTSAQAAEHAQARRNPPAQRASMIPPRPCRCRCIVTILYRSAAGACGTMRDRGDADGAGGRPAGGRGIDGAASGLTFSGLMPSSFITASDCAAKASLSSIQSRSSCLMPTCPAPWESPRSGRCP